MAFTEYAQYGSALYPKEGQTRIRAGQGSSLLTQEKEKQMRRKQYRRGSAKARKGGGKLHGMPDGEGMGRHAQRELGQCSSGRADAETLVAAILLPVNGESGLKP